MGLSGQLWPIYENKGEKGDKGDKGDPGVNANNISFPFAWGDATPQKIATVSAGFTVQQISIVLLTAFDVYSILTIGDAGDESRLVSAWQLDVTEANTYEINPNIKYFVETDINLYLILGNGCSTGNGLIIVTLQE
ncbi:MAG: hypothetical protein RLZZ419_258 [Pseudomonadota bacterium]|jgi:hypothetical protein